MSLQIRIDTHELVHTLISMSELVHTVRAEAVRVLRNAQYLDGDEPVSVEDLLTVVGVKVAQQPEARELATIIDSFALAIVVMALGDTPPTVLELALHSHGMHWGDSLPESQPAPQ